VPASVAERIGKHIGVGAAQLRRLARVSKWRSMRRRIGSGRPSKVTPALKEWFVQTSKSSGVLNDAADGEQDAGHVERGSLGVVFSLAHKLGFRRLRMRVCPFFSRAHMAARLAWTRKLTEEPNGAFAAPDNVYPH